MMTASTRYSAGSIIRHHWFGSGRVGSLPPSSPREHGLHHGCASSGRFVENDDRRQGHDVAALSTKVLVNYARSGPRAMCGLYAFVGWLTRT
jgi:hypothetical protein